jgi:hypothetical protein
MSKARIMFPLVKQVSLRARFEMRGGYLRIEPDKTWLQSTHTVLSDRTLRAMVDGSVGRKKFPTFAAARLMGQRELSPLRVIFASGPIPANGSSRIDSSK